MLTRRNFLKRASGALVALGAGIRPPRQAPDVAQGSVVPAGAVEILTSGEAAVTIARGSAFVLDSFGILDEAHVGLAQVLAKVEDDVIAARLIQTLDPKDFDSLAQYSGCIADIAIEFDL